MQVKCELWAWYSVGVNVVLAVINLVMASASDSLAVGAKVVHNIVDLVSVFGVLAGIKLAARKTERFPYGLYTLENVVAAVITVLIFVSTNDLEQADATSHRIELRIQEAVSNVERVLIHADQASRNQPRRVRIIPPQPRSDHEAPALEE
jgi:divalent metal cation (Fe/Co/Zn/Cd) transporter